MAELLRLTMRPAGRAEAVPLFGEALSRPMPFLLDSSLRDPELGRYSYVGADPVGWYRSRGNRIAWASPWGEERRSGHPIQALGEFLETLPRTSAGRTGSFPVGLVGYLSYDLGRKVERIPDAKPADLGIPDVHLGLYLRLAIADHAWGEVFRIAPRARIEYEPPPIPGDLRVPIPPEPIEPLTAEAFMETVREAKDAIAEGEIFQVNLSQRHALPLAGSPADAYRRMRSGTPAPYAAYLDAGDHTVLSASPELFLRTRGRAVETRPIKGTRPRGTTPAEDRRLATELLASAKDAAENVMIVDLERSDLGKVCEFGSVHVPVLWGLKTLPTVHHLESVVRGTLRPEVGIPDLLRATFPGGSITGAPKPRAMEIIERLEPHRRGVYTGAIGTLSLGGEVNLNVAIRTATVIGGTAYFAVGGGIVADSQPEAEYRETLDKLRGHAEALTGGRVEVEADGLRVG